ncbi:MAG: transposase, partial [Oscillospiraceae bacterium]
LILILWFIHRWGDIVELPKRKHIRLKDYDYSSCGAYFVTICTQNRNCIFVGDDSISSRMIDDIWDKTIKQFPNIKCPKYVIMPNHFHAIIVINRADMESAPTTTVSDVIQSFKRHTTIEYIKLVKQNILPLFDKHIWQRSFHDHIIRNEQEYQKIWEYIDTNPLKWGEDCFYGIQNNTMD